MWARNRNSNTPCRMSIGYCHRIIISSAVTIVDSLSYDDLALIPYVLGTYTIIFKFQDITPVWMLIVVWLSLEFAICHPPFSQLSILLLHWHVISWALDESDTQQDVHNSPSPNLKSHASSMSLSSSGIFKLKSVNTTCPVALMTGV